MPLTTIVKADGSREPFDPGKLHHSLVQAGAGEDAADSITAQIISDLPDDAHTGDIYKKAFEILAASHRRASRRYSLKRAVMELGPSGFPFEDYVAEILKRKGFQVKTRETVLGECVPHEIDVVAWNEKKLVMVEAKYHNTLGVKSDLKVVLYVKARLDDLSGMTYHYGFDRKLDEGWLVTNTKFTTTAIHYAECKGLMLVGWNYPEKGNLHDLILESGAVPITILSSLSTAEKRSLISQGVVSTDMLVENPHALKSFGFSDEMIAGVLDEIKTA